MALASQVPQHPLRPEIPARSIKVGQPQRAVSALEQKRRVMVDSTYLKNDWGRGADLQVSTYATFII